MEKSRTANSLRNFSLAFIEQFLFIAIAFVCRTVFITTLGKTYLGYNGLFKDVLSLLSLAELGVGTAITYFMYKPTAKKDYKKVVAYLNYYKKIYCFVGLFIGGVGLLIAPFIHLLTSDVDNLNDIHLIYLLYLANTTISYFFSYNRSILITQQKNYIISIIYISVIFVQNVFQIISLLLFKNYIVYLIIQILFTFLNNLIIYIYVIKKYPFIKDYKNETLSKKERKELLVNIKAMFTSKLSSAVVTSTDNILISRFVSTISLGLYSNYTLFVYMIRTVINKVFESIVGSIGNLVVSESNKRSFEIFEGLLFGNFWLVSYCSVTLFVFINPFIKIWIGDEYLLNEIIVIMICTNLYMRLMRNTLLNFLDTYGLFKELKKKNISEALINLVVSLILVLVFKLGIAGILLGTFISNIVTNFWYEPYLLYKLKFEQKLTSYFTNIIKYLIVTVISAASLYYINDLFGVCNGIVNLIIRVIVFSLFINVVYFIIFRKNKNFDFYMSKVKRLVKR